MIAVNVSWLWLIDILTLTILALRFLGFAQAISLVKKELENLIISSFSFPIA